MPEVFLIFGDYSLIFKMDMGIEGAGLATAIGAADYSAGHDGPFFLPEEFSQTGQAGTNGGKKPASSCDRVFHLLFSVGDETGGFAEDIDSQRAGGERNSDLAAACNCGSGLSVVRDAGYRAGGCHSP